MRIAPRRYSDSGELVEIERRLEAAPDAVDVLFEKACCLEDLGATEAAVQAYVAVLQHDSRHLATLTNLGSMLLARSDAEKARLFFTQALTHHPLDLITYVNLGQALFAQGEIASATNQYKAALAVDPQFFAAHHSLALLYEDTGAPEQAEYHWARAFEHGAAWSLPYAGSDPPALRVLLIVSGRGGDVVVHRFLDNRTMHVSMALADGYRSVVSLPRHDVVFNTIGEADSCRTALERAAILLRATTAPVINAPARVLTTGRADTAVALAGIDGALAPRTELLARAAIEASALVDAGWTFPLLVRAPGFQEGRHFELVPSAGELAAALARLPGAELFVIAFTDTRGADGAYRKYRVLAIDGQLYPVHLAVSADWKVHYFSADMTENAAHRAEEARFLGDVPGAIGARAFAALTEAARRLDLDYGGIDFGITADGSLVLFEANATMAVYPPPAGEQWTYRRPAFEAVIAAVRAMIVRRAARLTRF